MRVLLLGRLAFQGRVDGPQDVDLGGREGDQGGLIGLPVARLKELEGHRRGLGRDGGELEQALGLGDLGVLQSQALLLEKSEKLLDQPALAVPVDDPPSCHDIRERMSGQQAPADRLDPVRGLDFVELDEAQP
jgi:hypothetical protein